MTGPTARPVLGQGDRARLRPENGGAGDMAQTLGTLVALAENGGAGDMTQTLGALVALAGDLSCIPRHPHGGSRSGTLNSAELGALFWQPQALHVLGALA